MPPRTSKRTLYRLTGIEPTTTGLLEAVDGELFEEIDGRFEEAPRLTALGVESVVIWGDIRRDEADWCEEIRATTGHDLSVPAWRPYGLLLMAIDGAAYAVGYGQGFRLIRDRVKDTGFGLSFALRAVDPDSLSGITSKVLGQGRTDITLVPGGVPVNRLGIDDFLRIVSRLGGAVAEVELTVTRASKRSVKVHGGKGLELPLAVAPEELTADVRKIAQVCRNHHPAAELEFIELVAAVKDPGLTAELDGALEDLLADARTERIAAGTPAGQFEVIEQARHYRVKVNSWEWVPFDEFDLDHVLRRASAHRAGRRLEALREGKVALFEHPDAKRADALATVPAIRFLEADVSLGSRRFHLTDDQWYEIGERYVPEILKTVNRVITPEASVRLPPWPAGYNEGDYNDRVPRDCPEEGYLCLDKHNVTNPLKTGDSFEVCDLLAADGTLVMVKKAKASSSLSHLFYQGLVAVQLLLNDADVRERFAGKVAELGGHVPPDYRPKRVVFAILLKRGRELTPNTLFAFSQAALAQAVKALESWDVDVEVVGIKTAEEGE